MIPFLNGHGSGVEIEPGVVLTAEHVVAGKKRVVVFAPYKSPKVYYVMFYHDELDIAVLVDSFDRKLTQASRNAVAASIEGEAAVSVGYGGGSKLMAVYLDIGPASLHNPLFETYSQPIVSGMSGGPVYNIRGQVIGINSAIYGIYLRWTESELEYYKSQYQKFLNNGLMISPMIC